MPCAVRHFLPKWTDDGRTTARLANHNPMWCCLRAPRLARSLALYSRLIVQRQLRSADSTAPVTSHNRAHSLEWFIVYVHLSHTTKGDDDEKFLETPSCKEERDTEKRYEWDAL